MAVSFVVTIGLLIVINPAASTLSVLLYASFINVLIYVALPEWYRQGRQ
jgi:hypothetical protein